MSNLALTPSRPTPVPRLHRTPLSLGRLAVAALVLLAAAVLHCAVAVSAGADPPEVKKVLVVGDSLVVQAASALVGQDRTNVTVTVAAGSGSAPCDWVTGYTDPFTHRYFQFATAFDAVHPSVVVLAFTGNPGLDATATGCVDSSHPYTLTELLANYQSALTAMATYASAHGAQVYLSASPPRNPATPAGQYSDGGGGTEYGFNGVSQLNQLYQTVADSPSGRRFHWVYDTDAAQAVSDADLTWRLDEPCPAGTTTGCISGSVQVRAGGFDAIHLDTGGVGPVLYAHGLVRAAVDS